jgi:hypothetical protein
MIQCFGRRRHESGNVGSAVVVGQTNGDSQDMVCPFPSVYLLPLAALTFTLALIPSMTRNISLHMKFLTDNVKRLAYDAVVAPGPLLPQ